VQKGKTRFWLVYGLILLGTGFALLAKTWPEWIELAIHADPDDGNGSFEGGAAAAVGLVLMAFLSAPQGGPVLAAADHPDREV
jgi:hypothetical protein